MYIQGSKQYEFHVQHYGHPSKFGYKDVLALWKAENWEPETLIRKDKKAGAKYFMALGVHCDNFDSWNSRYHSWNAVNHGPQAGHYLARRGSWPRAAVRCERTSGLEL